MQSHKRMQRKDLARTQQHIVDNNQGYLEDDPDLHTDVDIELPRASARTRTTMSSKSRRTAQTARSSKPSEKNENIVRSRGRPIKPYETEPFLSIDNLPPEKTFVSEKSTMSMAVHSRASVVKGSMVHHSPRAASQPQTRGGFVSPGYNPDSPPPPSPHTVNDHVPVNISKDQLSRTSPGLTMQVKDQITSDLDPNKDQTTSDLDTKNDQNSRSPVEKTNGDLENNNVHTESANSYKRSRPSTANACLGSRKPEKQVRIDLRSHRPSTASADSRSHTKSDQQNSRPIAASQSRRSRPLTSPQRSRPGSQRSRFSSPRSTRPSTAGSRPGSRLVGLGFRSIGSRNGRVTPTNTPFHSPVKMIRASNQHIKSPFKHAVDKPEPCLDDRQTPSMGMKERTALAAFHVHKMLSVAGEKDPHKVVGKLKKGKLKPLYPVNVEGPNINNCRGIVSEAHSYEASPSRTLQRHLHLMNTIPNVHEYLYDRPRTVESVHQTSVASSVDENYDGVVPDTDRTLPDEIIYNEKSIMEPVTPENTFIPGQSHEPTYIFEDGAPAIVEETPRMFATEIDGREPDTISSDLTISNQLQHELHVSESGETAQLTQDSFGRDENNSNIDDRLANGDREMTEHDSKSRIGSSSKSVRFAEEKATEVTETSQTGGVTDTSQTREVTDASQTSKDMKQLKNETIAKQQNEGTGDDKNEDDTVECNNKKNTQGSCKDDNIEEIFKKDDHDDDDDGNRRERLRDNTGNGNNNNTQSGNNTAANGNSTDKGSSEKKGSSNNRMSDAADGKQRKCTQPQQRRPRSASLTRSRPHSQTDSARKGKLKPASDKHNKLSSGKQSKRPSSGNGRCSRFDKSNASKVHTQTLEVCSVIHGNSVVTMVGPESPKRSRSRSASPARRPSKTSNQLDSKSTEEFKFFSDRPKPCYELTDDFDTVYDRAQKSKVKFLLEGEEPEMETIFIDNDGDIDIRRDREINYDVLDSELAMLRSNIQNSLIENTETTTANVIEDDSEFQTECESDEENGTINDLDMDDVVKETETMDTIRGDYSNILEKYRQRCMERSETCGAISTALVTPRDTQSYKSTRSRSFQKDFDTTSEEKSTKEEKGVSQTVLSDSGRGSVENLSELSRSASVTLTPVPRLDLGGSTSDLGLDSGRSDITVTKDTVTEGNTMEMEDLEQKNLLELVCDQLSPIEMKQRTPSRKEVDEDVSDLKVVATTKSLSKNKQGTLSINTRAPFPPLCFTINARPPTGYLYYFAYGPDMNPNRFSSYIHREVEHRYWGLLFGFNLVFNKRGTSAEAGGFANIEFNPLRSVEGCIYKITQAELHILDKCVGYPQHFEHLVLPVWLSNSADPDAAGVSQYCVPALTYIAQQEWTETECQLPCDYALSQCIKSADVVTPGYRDSLVAMTTQQPVTVSG